MRSKYKDLEGKRIGSLIIEKYLCDEGNQPTFKCICDCGKVINKTYQYLNRKRMYSPASCGCKKGMAAIIFNKTTKTGFTSQYFKEDENVYRIEVVKKNGESYNVLVDNLGLSILKRINRTLSVDKRGYPFITKEDENGKQLFLMNILMCGMEFYDNKSNIVIDHINGNPLDNRLINLRITNNFGNSQNAKIRKDNSTGIKGFRILEGDRPLVKISCRIQSYKNRLEQTVPLSEEGLKYLILWDVLKRKELHDEFSNLGFDIKEKTLNNIIKEQSRIFIENLDNYYLSIFKNNGFKYKPKKYKKSSALDDLKEIFKDVDLNSIVA
ncbi:hypothetical protein QTH25_13690 [Clostridium perfringens]|uniref:hypothetical protein n=2 Tax=Clostridium perfringens TaxID=1502 RepID=UPI00339040BF|nr:hypothetical protein [Clostridium perfringens]